MFLQEKSQGEPQPSEAKMLLLRAEQRLTDPLVEWMRGSPVKMLNQECLQSAIMGDQGVQSAPLLRALKAVERAITNRYHIPNYGIPAWNDAQGRKFVDVLQVLRDAIEIVDTEFDEPVFESYLYIPTNIPGKQLCFPGEAVAMCPPWVAEAMQKQGVKYDPVSDNWILPVLDHAIAATHA